jgi:DNA-directed RNA polymerase specialized sigma24 family protein
VSVIDVREATTQAHREEWARVVASLTRRFGDLDIAEEAAAEAFTTAVERWPADGVPPNPGAWLTTTAVRKAIDRIRRENKRDDKHKEAQVLYDDDPREPLDAIDDERLRLIFTCCHPALAMETRVALTLRMVAGLTVPEIARAFLNPRQLRTWAPRRPGRHGMRAGALVACLACRSGRTRRGCDAGRHRSGHGGEREAGTGDIPRRRHPAMGAAGDGGPAHRPVVLRWAPQGRHRTQHRHISAHRGR